MLVEIFLFTKAIDNNYFITYEVVAGSDLKKVIL